MSHSASFDAAIASVASKFTIGGAAAGSTASLFSSGFALADWVTLAGFVFAGISFAVQMWFSWQQRKRAQREDERHAREEQRREKESAAYLEALAKGRITRPAGDCHDG